MSSNKEQAEGFCRTATTDHARAVRDYIRELEARNRTLEEAVREHRARRDVAAETMAQLLARAQQEHDAALYRAFSLVEREE